MGGCLIDRVMSQSEFGELVGITQQAVSDLQRRGVLRVNVTGHTWLLAYCEHLREEAAGRAGVLADASAALKIAQRQEVELRLAVKRGEFAAIGDLERAIAGVGRRVVAILEGIVPAIKRRMPSADPEILTLVGAEIVRARNEAATMSLSAIDDRDPDEAEK